MLVVTKFDCQPNARILTRPSNFPQALVIVQIIECEFSLSPESESKQVILLPSRESAAGEKSAGKLFAEQIVPLGKMVSLPSSTFPC
jgi:hypothetical protein